MEISNKFKKTALRTAFSYLERDPEENLPKLMAWVDRFAGTGPDSFEPQRDVVRAIVNDPTNNMYKLIMRIMKETDPAVLKVLFENFFLNANIIGWPKQEEYRKKHGCNIPWAILLDPTSACNLHCTGCWAAEYGNRLNLSFDEIDSIITQGKELGVYLYIYTGGEPLVRKKDLIALCEKHSDCEFLSFTNATLIDEDFANEMLRVGNFIPAISIEGFEEATDGRRGSGTYQHVVRAMQLLKEKHLPFGLSCCYTSQNLDSISDDKFIDQMIEWGADFVWYFHYMPVGNDAVPALLPNPEQRRKMYDRVRAIRREKAIFAMDFQNDGEFVGGCIAGGRRYLHINANGDADPCVFIHYSDSNIREKTLLEVLQSPLFMAYHDGQPFNENHLRPCPMLENPEQLREMIAKTGAHSTDLQSPESAEHLCAKCDLYAMNWKPEADRLWAESHPNGAKKSE
ncbi:radical SAM protein [Oscillospiraceae bacterium HCP3S3_F4]